MWAGADLIKAMEREGHKWLESADKLPSTLLKCTATFFLLPSHQSSDCLSLISRLSLQPFATCSFLLRDQAENRRSWTSVNSHNNVPVLIFTDKHFDVPVIKFKSLSWRAYPIIPPSFLCDMNKCLCLFSVAEQSITTDLIESHGALVCPLSRACCLLSFFLSSEVEEHREGIHWSKRS